MTVSKHYQQHRYFFLWLFPSIISSLLEDPP
jgi:hypothetical protein